MANKIDFIDCFCEHSGGESGPPIQFEQPIRSNNFHSTNITHIDRNYKSYPLVIVMIFSGNCMLHSTIACFEGIIYLPSIFLFLAAKTREGTYSAVKRRRNEKTVGCWQLAVGKRRREGFGDVGLLFSESNRWVSPGGQPETKRLFLTTEAQRTQSFFIKISSLCSLCLCGEKIFLDKRVK